MIKQLCTLTLSLLPFAGSAAIIADFQSTSVGSSPSGWTNDNNWDVVLDPTDSGNHVLSTTGRSGDLISGTTNNATLADGASGTLEFRFYLRSTTDGDLNVGMSDVSDLGSLTSSDAAFFGPLLRLVDGTISLYQGDGSGGGSFNGADQATSLNTWYTISMNIDNASDVWSGTIVGGAYSEPTALTYGSGSSSSFGFRTDRSNDLVNFVIRANSNNGFANGTFIDDISLSTIPEPQTYAMLGLVGAAVLLLRRRKA